MRTLPSLFGLLCVLTICNSSEAQEPWSFPPSAAREQAAPVSPRERSHAEERPFAFNLDPSTPSAGDLTAEYSAGVTSGVSADRPLPANLAHPGLVHSVTLGFGATARLAPFFTGKLLQPTEIGASANQTQGGGALGLRWQITAPGAAFRAALAGAGQREFGGTWVLWARAAFSYDVARVRVASNLHAERALAAGRDEVDLMMTAGVSYRALNELRLGAEYVAQDIEGLVDREEAEGGARHFAGPTVALDLGGGRAQLVLGPAFGLTQQSPRLLGRATLLVAFLQSSSFSTFVRVTLARWLRAIPVSRSFFLMHSSQNRQGSTMTTAITMSRAIALGGVGAILGVTAGCNKDFSVENRMAWAAGDRGGAVVDVTRRVDGNRLDTAVVRSGPGFQYPQIGSLRTGTQVTVIDNARNSNGNWSRISFANGEGWIHQDILLKSREFQGKDPSSFAGYYETNYGQCTLQTSGSQVVGSCSDSTSLRCNIQGITLFCGWSTANSGRQGQARLSKHTDGSLVGTWGYNGDNINGGTWKFSRR